MIRSVIVVTFSDVASIVPINVAESGAISANADTAFDVFDLAFASRYFPSNTNEINSEELSNDCINRGLPLPKFTALYSTADTE